MLVIKEATYGQGNQYANVTKMIQSLVKDDSIDLKVGPATIGTDPSPGSKKTLSVIYVVDGVQDSKEVADGSTFTILTPKKDKGTSGAKEGARSITDVFMSALGIFLHVTGIGIAYRVGTALFDTVVAFILTGISAYIPYFGLWGVPLLVFTYRLFRSEDFPGLAQLIQNGSDAMPKAAPA